jgi:hypothetical protein
MKTDTKQSSNEAENGNKSKPLLCEVFLSEGWISAKNNPPANNKNVVVKSFFSAEDKEDFEEEIAYYEDGKWNFYNESEWVKEVLYYFIYPSSC